MDECGHAADHRDRAGRRAHPTTSIPAPKFCAGSPSGRSGWCGSIPRAAWPGVLAIPKCRAMRRSAPWCANAPPRSSSSARCRTSWRRTNRQKARRPDQAALSACNWRAIIRFQRFDRLEILRRDLGLRNREIELGFDAEHQIDHVHRGQPDIHQPRVRIELHGNRILLEDRLDQRKDPALNVGVKGLHRDFPFCRRAIGQCRTASRDLTRGNALKDSESRLMQALILLLTLMTITQAFMRSTEIDGYRNTVD